VSIVVSGPPSPFVAELAQARPAEQPWPDDAANHSGDNGTGGRRATVTSRSAPGTTGKKAAVRRDPSSPAEAARREALASWRKQRASDDGVPAYVVLDNKTLDAIAADQPTSLGELGRIKGIGPAKLERYGAEVLGILASSNDE
jgi:superfamily II DNA helicase RecQ